MSLRKISAELARRGHLTAKGRPYVATAVQSMLRKAQASNAARNQGQCTAVTQRRSLERSLAKAPALCSRRVKDPPVSDMAVHGHPSRLTGLAASNGRSPVHPGGPLQRSEEDLTDDELAARIAALEAEDKHANQTKH
jgi:hypothetical protein